MGNMRSVEDTKTCFPPIKEAKKGHDLTVYRHNPTDVEMIGKAKERLLRF